MKKLFSTWTGWLAILLANLLWSSFWLVPLIAGFVLADESLYVMAGGIYLFFLQPLIPMWLIVPATALLIHKRVARTIVYADRGTLPVADIGGNSQDGKQG